MFRFPPAPLIGLDIGASALTWVELGRDRSAQLVLERCVVEPLPAGWLVDGHVEQFDALAAAVQRLLSASRSRTRDVALAMPSAGVRTPRLRLPAGLTPAQMLAQVQAYAALDATAPVEALVLDFGVDDGPDDRADAGLDAGPTAAASPGAPSPRLPATGDLEGAVHDNGQSDVAGHVDVWLVSAPQAEVQDRLGLVESAGLRALVLDVDSHARARAASRLIPFLCADPGAAVALLELHGAGAHALRLQHGRILEEAHQPWRPGRRRWLGPQSAGSGSGEGNDEGDTNGTNAAKGAQGDQRLDVLGDALQALLGRVDGVLLSSSLPDIHLPDLSRLAEALHAQTGLPCRPADPFEGLRLGAAVAGPSAWRGAALAGCLTACGLALRRFAPAC